MAHKSKNKTLRPQSLATLFVQLSQMETAGIPVTTAVSLVTKTDTELSNRLVRMLQLLNAGSSIADAGFKAGIFTNTLRAMINAAENSGKLSTVYKQLATYYEAKFNRLKNIKSRLYLPALTLLLALFIKPIPLLVNSEITVFNYLSLSIGRFLIIVTVLFVAFKLPSWFKSAFHKLQLQLPLVGDWVVKRQLNSFLIFLSMMLDAGLTFEQALPLATETLENAVLKKRFNKAVQANHSGSSVTNILSEIDDIPASTIKIVDTGEQSGKLASSILHFTNHQAETIQLQDDSLAEWLPRFFYTGVALWMTVSLLS